MPKVVEVAEKRREILSAAAAIFVQHGYSGTNLQRVAERAGMGKSSLYHYFTSKEALFTALADEILRQETDLFEAQGQSTDPAPERLRALIDNISSLFDDWAAMGPLLVDLLRQRRGRRQVQETFRRARAAVAQLIHDGQVAGQFRSGSPQALATVVLACIDGLFLQELVERHVTREVARGALLGDMILSSLRPREER
jgi:AcrR family transcriptional regulator